MCLFFSAFATLLVGPSRYLGLPEKNLIVVMTGMFILGTVQAFIVLPILPEVIDVINLRYRLVEGIDEELEGKVHDTISSLYTFFFSFSGLISPIIGSYIYEHI